MYSWGDVMIFAWVKMSVVSKAEYWVQNAWGQLWHANQNQK